MPREKQHKYTVTLALETDQRQPEEEVRAAVEQALLEQWGWVGFDGDPRVKVTSVESST